MIDIVPWLGWAILGGYWLLYSIPKILYELGYDYDIPWWAGWECPTCEKVNYHPIRFANWECTNCEELNWQKSTEAGHIPSDN